MNAELSEYDTSVLDPEDIFVDDISLETVSPHWANDHRSLHGDSLCDYPSPSLALSPSDSKSMWDGACDPTLLSSSSLHPTSTFHADNINSNTLHAPAPPGPPLIPSITSDDDHHDRSPMVPDIHSQALSTIEQRAPHSIPPSRSHLSRKAKRKSDAEGSTTASGDGGDGSLSASIPRGSHPNTVSHTNTKKTVAAFLEPDHPQSNALPAPPKTPALSRNNWHAPPKPVRPDKDGRAVSFIQRTGPDSKGKVQCNYIDPNGVRCTRRLVTFSFERHDKTHRDAEARTFLHYRHTHNIDVLDMAQILTAVIGELARPGSSIKWEFAGLLPFNQIPEGIEKRLIIALKKASWNPSDLPPADLKEFRIVAVYLAQWYAHKAYTCVCFLGDPKPRLWVRCDEYQGEDRHPSLYFRPDLKHELWAHWREDTLLIPYHEIKL